ncbi:hypothetical protein [Lysinibacillus capsici]|uniref:hypothetical protein n=1 Tax=Lysinibacillus capsici TaxID=2115968 RepID=UPI003BAD049A
MTDHDSSFLKKHSKYRLYDNKNYETREIPHELIDLVINIIKEKSNYIDEINMKLGSSNKEVNNIICLTKNFEKIKKDKPFYCFLDTLLEIIEAYFFEDTYIDKFNSIFKQTRLAYYITKNGSGKLEWELKSKILLKYQLNKQKLDKTEAVLRISKVIGLISLISLILLSLSYLTTYSFLYGYYFGETSDESSSNFSIIRFFVPFNYNTITYTSIIISASTALIMYILYLVLEKEIVMKVIAILAFAIFHLLLTFFFVSKLDLAAILNFFVIWMLPLTIAASILMTKIVIENPLKIISGFASCFIFLIIVATISTNFDFDIPIKKYEFLVTLLIIIFPLLFGRIPYKNSTIKFFFLLPVIILIFILSVLFLSKYFNIINDFTLLELILSILSAIIITGFLTFYFGKKMEDNKMVLPEFSDILDLGMKIIPLIFVKKTQKLTLVPIGLFIISIYIIIPRMGNYAAENIRDLIETNENRLEKIVFKDGLNKQTETIGTVIVEKNGVIYISNEKWELELIKTSYYYISKN